MSRPAALLVVIALMTTPDAVHAQSPTSGPVAPGGPVRAEADTLHEPPEPGSFPRDWISGSDCANDPAIQVHAYNDDFYILRQSMCSNFEGPFMYLLFGEHTAVLFDTGANGNPPVAATVYAIIEDWKARNGVSTLQLLVAHTHGHGDHMANDNQFVGMPDTTLLGTGVSAVKAAFDLPDWPDGEAQLDLGGRVLTIFPIPGHQAAHIAIYDPRTDILITGDSVYPGFLFISQFSVYRDSIGKLVQFSETHPVKWVLGTHIEMTSTPGVAYPYGTNNQPMERELQLTPAHLVELHDALRAMGSNPVDEVHDDFIITP